MLLKAIKEFGTVGTGTTPSMKNKNYYSSNDVMFIKPGDINDELTEIEESTNHLSNTGANKARIFPTGTVLCTCIGIIGKVAVVNKIASCNQQINYIIPYKHIDSKFLAYSLLSRKNELQKLGSNSVVVPIINKSNFENQLIPWYKYELQIEIRNSLDNILNLINVKRDEYNSLNLLIKSRFIEMFGRIDNTNFPIDCLDNICEFIKDGTHQTPTYTEDYSNGFKFISSKDVITGKICWDNIKYITPELHEKLYKTISPRRNDLLLAKNGTTGIGALVDTDDIFDIYVSVALLRQSKMNPIYFKEAINSEDSKRQFDDSLKGVGVPNLHLGEIKKTKIIVPSFELQEQFADFVQLIDKSKFIVQKQIQELQELLDSKMDEYFN